MTAVTITRSNMSIIRHRRSFSPCCTSHSVANSILDRSLLFEDTQSSPTFSSTARNVNEYETSLLLSSPLAEHRMIHDENRKSAIHYCCCPMIPIVSSSCARSISRSCSISCERWSSSWPKKRARWPSSFATSAIHAWTTTAPIRSRSSEPTERSNARTTA